MFKPKSNIFKNWNKDMYISNKKDVPFSLVILSIVDSPLAVSLIFFNSIAYSVDCLDLPISCLNPLIACIV